MINNLTKELAESLMEIRNFADIGEIPAATYMVKADAVLDRYIDALRTPEPVITRVEVITDTREYVHWNPYNKITTSLQDDGKTLKVFVNKVKEDIDIIKECRQTGRTGTTTNKLLEKAFYEQITEIEETMYPKQPKPINMVEIESKRWALALARLIDEIGEEAPSYSEWDAMRTSPERLVEYLRELMKYREQLVADEELGACCAVMEMNEGRVSGNVLRAIRRPKPTLKSQALRDFETVRKHSDLLPEILDTIENALKSIPE
jgi:predicted DNA-binding ribbon-helix-helix protein